MHDETQKNFREIRLKDIHNYINYMPPENLDNMRKKNQNTLPQLLMLERESIELKLIT